MNINNEGPEIKAAKYLPGQKSRINLSGHKGLNVKLLELCLLNSQNPADIFIKWHLLGFIFFSLCMYVMEHVSLQDNKKQNRNKQTNKTQTKPENKGNVTFLSPTPRVIISPFSWPPACIPSITLYMSDRTIRTAASSQQ
jgi:hypothetical protein